MEKRISSLFLAAVMVFTMLFTLLPVTAYADELIPVGASDFAGGDGTEYDPYLIETAEQLNNVRNFLGEEYRYTYFKLIATISLSAYPNWEPIGNEDNPFYGRFYSGSYNIGSDYQITDLTINRPDESYVGLFGCCGDAMFVNLTIEGANVTGGPKTGILAGALGHKITEEPGRVFNGKIDKCSSTGSVRSSTKPADGRVGGLVGEVIKTTSVKNSNSTASVTGAGSVGGVAGYVADGGTVENCYSAGSVTGIVTGSYYAGGVAGYVDGGGTVQDCYATGSVTGARSVGGVVGFVNTNGVVRRCAARNSSVSGTYDVGGVAGTVEEGTVEHCYAACSVTGSYYVGGVVGYAFNFDYLLCCYATGSVTGQYSVGGVVGSVEYVTVLCCAALNPSVSGSSNVGRVAGSGYNATFERNYAFSGVTVTVDGTVTPITDGAADNISGANKTAAEIKAGGISGLFTEYFTTENGKLPGFGAAVDMPAHIVDTITITTTSLPDGTVGIAYSQTLAATGGMLITWTIDSGSLPNGLSLSGNTISGTPGAAGTFDFTVKAENAEGSDTMAFEIVIGSTPPVGTAPAITTTSLPDGTVGIAYSQTLAATGDTPITWSIVSGDLPGGLSLSGNTISGTPGAAGTFDFTVKAENAEGGDTKALKIVIGSTTVTGAEISPATGGFDRYSPGDVTTAITWNSATAVTGISDGTMSLASPAHYGVSGSTLTIKEAYLETQAVGSVILTITFDQGDPATLTVSVTDSTPPSISPVSANYDLTAPDDVTTTITLNSASTVTGVVYDANSLATDTDYTVTGSALTIKDGYLSGLAPSEGDTLVFDISFDTGDTAALTVHVVDSYTPSGDADLSDLTVGGSTVGGFDPADDEYDVELPYGTQPGSAAAAVGAAANDPLAQVSVTQASALPGSATVTVTAEDGTIKTYTVNFTLGAAPGTAPAIITTSLPGGTVGIAYSQTLAATGDTPITWSIVSGDLPGGLSLSGNTISGTPGAAGTFDFTIKAENAEGDDTKAFEIVIGSTPPVGTAPAITTTSLPDGTVGIAYSQTLAATGDTPITWSIVSGDLPGGLSLSGNTISGTPGAAGTFDFTVKAENAEGSDTMALEIVIGSTPPVGTAPAITTTSLPDGRVGSSYSRSLSAAGDTPITWTIDGGSLPNGLTLGGSTGVISGTPTARGNFSFTVKATNAVGSVTKELSITINAASTGGGSGGGSSDSGTTVIIQPEKKPDQPVMAGFSATPAVNSSGHATVTVSQKSVADAIAKAQADAKAQGKSANGIGISLNIDLPDTAKSLGIVLPQATLKSLVDAGVKQLEINGVIVSLDLDLEALKEIQKQSTGDVTITLKPVQNLSAAAKKLIGARPVYDMTISYVKDGKTVNITSLGKGSATLSLPYTPNKNEAAGYLFGVYVDGKGNATRIPGSAYDSGSGSIILGTDHFSIYGVGYTSPSEKYTDIATHWASESIDYAVGRGLFSGTTEKTFSPNMAMDRGMLVTVLGRLAGADVSAYKTSSFTDVATGTYYLPYVEWAYKKGIVQGIGSGKFDPERAVTREEIAVILTNYAKATGYTLPVTREAVTFADSSAISSIYRDAVKSMQQAGIMMGGSGNKFNPKASATRAEVATMLHRYVKLTIDPATAQGWAKNDDGRYMYYKDGKPLTGWQTIDGTRYFFHTNGTLQTGWVKDGDNWRFYSGNKALIGWWDIGSETYKKHYYFDVNAVMVFGKWLQIDGKWYYFYTDGSLAVSTKIGEYEVDENGVRKTK